MVIYTFSCVLIYPYILCVDLPSRPFVWPCSYPHLSLQGNLPTHLLFGDQRTLPLVTVIYHHLTLWGDFCILAPLRVVYHVSSCVVVYQYFPFGTVLHTSFCWMIYHTSFCGVIYAQFSLSGEPTHTFPCVLINLHFPLCHDLPSLPLVGGGVYPYLSVVI